MWMIAFEDPDKGISLYRDENKAREDYAIASVNWNCTLFVSVDELDKEREAAKRDTGGEIALLKQLAKKHGYVLRPMWVEEESRWFFHHRPSCRSMTRTA